MTDRQSQNVANVAAWSIKVGGAELPRETMDVLISAEVESSLELPDQAVLRFHDKETSLADSSTFDPGKELEISLLQNSRPATPPLFKGEIVALEPAFKEDYTATLTVRAYDKRHRMNREPKTATFKDSKDSDIVSTMAGAYGLSPQVTATSQVRKMVFQQAMTDLEFLSLLAARNAFEVYAEDGKLYFAKPATNSQVTLDWGLTLLSFNPRLSLAGQVDKVEVRGWDHLKREPIMGQATSSKSAPQVGFGKSGGAAAKSAYAAASYVEVRHIVRNQSEANALAQSMLDDINNEFLEADGVAIGDPKIRAGKVVSIKKVGTRFAGTYRISSAQHVWEDGDYKVYFHVGGSRPKQVSGLVSAAAGQSSVTSASTPAGFPAAGIAVVTNNEDPENMGRVKLKFPWFWGDGESEWARVSMAGAGNDRGFFCLPEVNDEVLVVFLHGDMDSPVVVGGLYNSKDKPPVTTANAVKEGAVVNRTMKTRTGHIIELKEESGAKSITIKDGQGVSEMTMDSSNKEVKQTSSGKSTTTIDGEISIESKTAKVTVKASGDIVIDSKANVNIKAAANVSIEGNGQVTLKGNGPVTVQSAAILQLKGSMVQIN